jgi:hypothetical protein
MATIRELVVKFGFDVDENALKKLDKDLDVLKLSFGAVAAAAAGAFGTLFGLAKTTANFADEIADTALAVGVTNNELQRLAYASQLSGGGLETVSDGLKFLARNAQAAIDGSQETAETFARLGVSLTDSNGKMKASPALMLEIADAFKTMGPGAKTTAIAMDIFGRSGAKMIPMLVEGADGIAALGAEAEAFGAILGDESIKQGNEFNDELDRLKVMAMGIVRAIGSGLFPVVSEVTKTFREWISANRELIKQNLQKFVGILQKVLRDIWRVTYAVGRAFFGLIGFVNTLASKITWLIPLLKTLGALFAFYVAGKVAMALFGVVKGFLAIGKAATIANLKVMAIPILIGAAIAAVLLIVEDLFAFLDGRPSFLGFLVKNWPQIVAKLKEVLNNALSWARGAVQKIAVAIAEFLGLPTEKAKVLGEAIAVVFDGIVGTVKYALNLLWTILSGGVDVLGKTLSLLARGLVALVTDPVGAIIDFFKGGALRALMEFVGVIWQQTKNIFAALTDPFKKALGWLGKFGGVFGKLGINVESLQTATSGGAGMDFTDAGSMPPAFPTPGQTLNTSNVNAPAQTNNNFQPTINVSVPAGADANQIGGAVSKAAGLEFERILRQSSRATTPVVQY